jgi:hypothetical protein
VSIFKNLKINIVVNAIYRYKVNSLTLLFLIANLLADICYTI